jgi:hypothetical protein
MDKRLSDIEIKVQLNDQQMVSLLALYGHLTQRYVVMSAFHRLLHTHIWHLRDRIGEQVRKVKTKYTIRLCGAELVAFVQLWANSGREVGGVAESSDVEVSQYNAQIIQKFFNEVAETALNQKRLIHA